MPTQNKRHAWYLRKIPALAVLPHATLDELAGVAELRERPRKTCLYLAGDAADRVFFLHGGRVHALHVTEGSRTISLGMYGPTDVFGESCLWTVAAREHMAVAASAVLYTELPRALLRLVLDEHPAAASLLAEQAIVRRDLVIRRLCVALSASVRARLADQLLALAERGQDTPAGRELAFSITHQELAALIGTTRETVSLELQRLERDGLVLRRGRQIFLRDIPRLQASTRGACRGTPRRVRSPGRSSPGPSRMDARAGAPVPVVM